MVGASASQSIELGFNPLATHTKRSLKIVSTASLLDSRHLVEVVENKPASLFVVSLGKALNGILPSLDTERNTVVADQYNQKPSNRVIQSVDLTI